MAGTSPRPGTIIDGINVTPLVDIMMVLLVIFIVTAKLVVTPAVPLDLPRATRSEGVQTIFSVSVPATGSPLVNGSPVPDDGALLATAQAAAGRDRDLRAVVQADASVPHGRVIGVLDTLRQAGLAKVAFATRAADETVP